MTTHTRHQPNRTATGLLAALLLATGLVLGQVVNVIMPGGATYKPNANAGARLIAERYYDAVNTLLQSGDESALRELLHPDFNDHLHSNTDPRDVSSLIHALNSIREQSPSLNVHADITRVEGGMVLARLTLVGSSKRLAGDVFVVDAPTSGGFEVLRVDGQTVIERWSETTYPEPQHLRLLGSLDIDPAARPQDVYLERVEIDRYSSFEVTKNGGSIIVAESGTPNVIFKPLNANQEHTESATSIALRSGEAQSIPGSVPFTVRNAGLERAVVLFVYVREVFDFIVVQSSGVVNQRDQPGIRQTLLAYGPIGGGTACHCEMKVHELYMPPGSRVPDHATAGAELILVTEGQIDASISGGTFRRLTPSGTLGRIADNTRLAADEAIAAEAGVLVAYAPAVYESAAIVFVALNPLPPAL